MPIVISDSSQEGGVALLLFHCVFNGSESITHFTHEIDFELYQSLPNAYAICIAEKAQEHKKVTAGFIIKTNCMHHDSNFTGILTNAAMAVPKLMSLIGDHSSFLPARLGISGDTLPTEMEMLRIMTTQALKHGVAGTA